MATKTKRTRKTSKTKYDAYIDKDTNIHYMRCLNSEPEKSSPYYNEGHVCSNWVRVGNIDEVSSVVCWKCVAAKTYFPKQTTDSRTTGYPRGWALRAVYVDKDGNVFHKGVEQPDLKGTLEPTVVQKKTNQAAKTRRQNNKEKKEERAKLLGEVVDLKYKLRHGAEGKEKQTIEKKILRLEKKIKKL